MSAVLVLQIIGTILLFLASFPGPGPYWTHTGWLGLFFFALSVVVK